MSVVQNPLIGATRQKMGNAVFSTWKGIYVLKTKPVSVANPDTDKQQMQRSAMSQIVAIFRQIPSVVNVGFKKLAVKMSPYNAFASYNLRAAFDLSAPPAADLQPENVLTSKGTIAQTPIALAVADVSNATIGVTWTHTDLQPGQSLSDLATIAAYNITQDDWTGGTTTAQRSADTADIPLPAGWVAGDSVQVYLAFYNSESGNSSDSVNDNTTVQA